MQPAEFDRHAALEDRHWWFRARREIVFHLLRRHLPADAGRRVLEVGCGTGGNLRFLARHYRSMGVEIDAYAAGLARARCPCEIRCGALPEVMDGVDFAPEAVLMLDVLEHVADDAALLGRALDLVGPGGLLVLTVPADPRLWSAHDRALGHLRRYTADSLAGLWCDRPVDTLLLSGFNSLLYPLMRVARGLRRDASDAGSDLAPVNPLANALLHRIFAAERHLLARRPLAWGASLAAILRKRQA